jgi:hypothetical protein
MFETFRRKSIVASERKPVKAYEIDGVIPTHEFFTKHAVVALERETPRASRVSC